MKNICVDDNIIAPILVLFGWHFILHFTLHDTDFS